MTRIRDMLDSNKLTKVVLVGTTLFGLNCIDPKCQTGVFSNPGVGTFPFPNIAFGDERYLTPWGYFDFNLFHLTDTDGNVIDEPELTDLVRLLCEPGAVDSFMVDGYPDIVPVRVEYIDPNTGDIFDGHQPGAIATLTASVEDNDPDNPHHMARRGRYIALVSNLPGRFETDALNGDYKIDPNRPSGALWPLPCEPARDFASVWRTPSETSPPNIVRVGHIAPNGEGDYAEWVGF